jgi:hypothetical protein
MFQEGAGWSRQGGVQATFRQLVVVGCDSGIEFRTPGATGGGCIVFTLKKMGATAGITRRPEQMI